MEHRVRRQLRHMLVIIALGVFAAAAAYATIGDIRPPTASREGTAWIKAMTVATVDLSKAVAEGMSHAVVEAAVESANSAAQSAGSIAKGSAPAAKGRSGRCPLCTAGIKICPKRASSGA